MSEARERARSVLAAALGLEREAIDDGAAIGTLDAWDSLAHMRLIQALEQALGAELEPETIVALASLEDIAAILTRAPPSA